MSESNKHFIAAENFMKAEQYEKALSSYNLAVNDLPESPLFYSQRAVCFFHLKQLESALSDMNKSVELDPDYSYRYASRAYIKDALGDVKGAVEDYRKATELDPEDAVSFNNLGLLEEKLGYVEASKKNFKRADELAKILDETGIVTEEELMNAQTEKPKNIQKEIETEKEEIQKSSVSKEMLGVFMKKESFKEFISFIKNGFKRSE